MLVDVKMRCVDTQIKRSVLLSKVRELSDQVQEQDKSKKVSLKERGEKGVETDASQHGSTVRCPKSKAERRQR
jgi:hypothetical protein